MLAALVIASLTSAAPSATAALDGSARAVRGSRIRSPALPASDPGLRIWGSVGLGTGLSTASAPPEPPPTARRAPERGFSGMTDAGPTGLMLAPSGRVLRSGWWATGLHRGVVKGAVGILGIAEAGATAPDIYEPLNSHIWRSRSAGFVKVSGETLAGWLVDPAVHPPAWRAFVPVAAVGLENAPDRKSETAWAGATWDVAWPWLQADLSTGWGTGRFRREAFWGAGIMPSFLLGTTLKFTGEYAGRRGISGVRFAISRNLRLDFAMRFDVTPRQAPRDGWSITTAGATLGVSQAGRLRIVDFIRDLVNPRRDPPIAKS